ncbi:MAG: HlyD family efflux transporter periplasmic adaptor subunit [Okeania sp. SIO2F4]|uniref:HlyD family secretion protein n=1 Tax=Okeania sp. SIO2F4 TaxID=2607790 RepID=UPI00142B47B1|nr:HlyD family efflux transporter periplasmic adaptor subunit [Okeania sp. SIO2F4]NES04055.1 HlyD family efflux transporter periplasmic adaptor subunit [Okeania sp. SIO2F4]
MFNNSDSIEVQPLESDEFLPPMSRWNKIGGMFLVGTFGAAIALMSVVKYNPTVRTEAIARPTGDVRIVQALTEGKVDSIDVNENQAVQMGDTIARIDESALNRQKNQLQEKIKQCDIELEQINQQLSALEVQIIATAKPQTFQQSRSTTLANNKIDASSIESAILELSQSLPTVAQQFAKDRRDLIVKRTELIKELTTGNRELEQINIKLDNSIISAPANGTILKLSLRNPGQTVESGAAIAQIVPSNTPLVFKGRVTAADIARVKVGQPVQLRISAYPFPDYGILKGTVSSISPDAIAPEVLQEAYYEVTIKPERPYLVKGERKYPIQPGMEGRADIISSQETVLTFALRKVRLLTDF